MHDDTVDRTTDGTGLVSALSIAEIRALHLKTGAGGPGATVTSEHVPTVEEGLVAAKGKFLVNLHLKVPVETKVAELVKHMKMTNQVTTWVTAQAGDLRLLHSPLRGVIGLIPTINECGAQYPEPCMTAPIESLQGYSQIHPVAFFLDFRQSHAFIQAVSRAKRPAGTRIFTETLSGVDDLPMESRHAEWRSLLDMGVSVIMTNRPGDLIDFLKTIEFKSGPADSDPLLKPIVK
jgi:glycerophosphoryl diester phosphodiesterase